MDGRIIQVIYGEGLGKSSAAVGKCIQALSHGKRVIFISFLKGKGFGEYECLKRLEPEMKIFCFEKEEECYAALSLEKKEEEKQNILNGFHFANKVAETGECELLVLDEVLGLLDLGMISIQDLYRLIEHSGNYDTSLVMTGKYIPKELLQHIDVVSEIRLVKDNSEK
jgi:hypothetical protein